MNVRKSLVMFILLMVSVLSAGPAVVLAQEEPRPEDKVPELKFLTATPSYDRNRYEASMMIAENWRKLGMDVNVLPSDFTVVSTGTRTAPWDFHAFMHAQAGRTDRLDPDKLVYDILHSSQNINKGNNRVGLSDPEYDRLADAQREELDLEKRRAIVFKCQEVLARLACYFPIFYPENLSAANTQKFKGYVGVPGEDLYNEWTPVLVEPLTSDKILKVVNNVDLDNLNPFPSTSTWNWKVLRLVYDKLVRIGPDLTPVPASAEKWEFVEPTVVVVTLRSGLKFHDGKPVTVEDVKFSFDSFMKLPGYMHSFADPIKKVEIVDDRRVRFTLKEPYAPFVQDTLGSLVILPKHIWEGVAEREKVKSVEDWKNPNPIGSGPFKFVHWRKGEEVRLERFAGHYNPPKVDGMIYTIVGNEEGVFGALETKRADMCGWNLSSVHYDMARKLPYLTTFKLRDHGFTFLGLNVRKPPFSDLNFRQAVAHTLDYQTFVDVLLNGYGEPGRSGGVIAPVIKFYYNPNVPQFEFSLTKAREKLQAAGYRWDKKGKLYYPKKP